MFPGGHPSKYWRCPMLLNFSDRTRTGVFNMVWSQANTKWNFTIFTLMKPILSLEKGKHFILKQKFFLEGKNTSSIFFFFLSNGKKRKLSLQHNVYWHCPILLNLSVQMGTGVLNRVGLVVGRNSWYLYYGQSTFPRYTQSLEISMFPRYTLSLEISMFPRYTRVC